MNDQPEFKSIGEIEAVTVIGVSYQHQLDKEKGLVFQTHIPSNASPSAINGALDRLVDAAERQRARVRIPVLEHDIQTKEDLIYRAQSEMFRLDKERELAREQAVNQWRGAGKRGEVRISATQQNEDQKALGQRNQVVQNAELFKNQLIGDRNELAQLKALVGEG